MSQLLEKAKEFLAEKMGTVKTPEANVEDLDLKKVSMDCVEYNAKVSVDNPYAVSLPICEINYTLKSSGRVIATGTIPDPGSIKASDKTMLNVPVKVPHGVLMSLARDIGADWDIDYELELALIIDIPVVGNITIPISQKGEIKLPSFSDLWKKEEKEATAEA